MLWRQVNSSACCFDGGDCFTTNSPEHECVVSCNNHLFQTSALNYRADADAITFLGNFICDLPVNNAPCCYDLNDCHQQQQHSISHSRGCPSCDQDWKSLSNHYCNAALNNIHCCFDAGDCFQDGFQCTGCQEDMSWFRDAICDQELNSLDCCYDGGDCPCPTCNVRNRGKSELYRGIPLYHLALGNLQCDRLLNTPECCYDGFDCQLNSRSPLKTQVLI